MDTITSPPSNINPDSAPTGPSIIPASIPPTDQAPYTTTVIGNTAPNLEPQHITSAPYRSQFDEQPFTYTTTYTTTGPTYTTHSMAPPTSSQMQVTSAQFNPPPPSTTTAAPIGSSHASVIPPAATTTMPPTVTYVQSSQYSCPHCHGPLPDSMFRTHKKSKVHLYALIPSLFSLSLSLSFLVLSMYRDLINDLV